MDVTGREEQEEGPVLVGPDEGFGFPHEIVGHVLILEQGALAALHVADASEAVDDRCGVGAVPLVGRDGLPG